MEPAGLASAGHSLPVEALLRATYAANRSLDAGPSPAQPSPGSCPLPRGSADPKTHPIAPQNAVVTPAVAPLPRHGPQPVSPEPRGQPPVP